MSSLTYASPPVLAQEPPPPIEEISPCGSGDGGNTGAPPPPVGLCLPINAYLLPMLLSGICYGAFKMRRFERI